VIDGLLDRYAADLHHVIRTRFDAQADGAGPREFGPVGTWEDFIGWDDGYTLNRAVLMTAPAVWSDTARARVRPVVFIAIGSDSQPHFPYGTRPTVPPFVGGPTDPAGIPLDEAVHTEAGGWARALMTRLGGEHPLRWPDGWVSFTVTLPDEPPWIPPRTREG
jgi:hypothetical protein